jgi:hypothetical protein
VADIEVLSSFLRDCRLAQIDIGDRYSVRLGESGVVSETTFPTYAAAGILESEGSAPATAQLRMLSWFGIEGKASGGRKPESPQS